jgi:hypothetical protein
MNETDRRFMAALQTRIDQLTAENAELKKENLSLLTRISTAAVGHQLELNKLKRDAERYRYLKRNGDASNGQPFIARYNGSFSRWTGDEADDVIDAALKGQQ